MTRNFTEAEYYIDLASFGVDVQNVTKPSIGIDGAGAQGILYIDNIRPYRQEPFILSLIQARLTAGRPFRPTVQRVRELERLRESINH